MLGCLVCTYTYDIESLLFQSKKKKKKGNMYFHRCAAENSSMCKLKSLNFQIISSIFFFITSSMFSCQFIVLVHLYAILESGKRKQQTPLFYVRRGDSHCLIGEYFERQNYDLSSPHMLFIYVNWRESLFCLFLTITIIFL